MYIEKMYFTQAKGKDVIREFQMSCWRWERLILGKSCIPWGYSSNAIVFALSHRGSSSVVGVNALFPRVRFGPYSQCFLLLDVYHSWG